MDARDTMTRLPLPFTGRQWWAWFDAWEHVDLVELITIGEHPAPQLTAWPTRLRPPCSCTYGLHQTLWNPTHLIDIAGVGQRGAAFTFRIDPFCPHHGEPPYIETLDEDERRGH